ncbi:DNA replication complex GINS protein SLD5-like [Babylonia areolata]|uniref:DNA replication complex GINS protein SLD5-like n=1 Tax=Babylonia areolata TaxID=304850 RepID=UPI003FD3C654
MDEVDSIHEEGGTDDDDVEMTAAEVLQKLEDAWLNEKFSPELLDARMDLVECMMDQLAAMEENLKRADKGDLKISLHRMEVDRIRFIVASYLRIRLQKIEKFTSDVLWREEQKKEDDEPLMSDSEREFARKFLALKKTHFDTLALKHMPPNMQSAEKEMEGVKPKLDSYVFLRVKESSENVLVEEDTIDAGEELIDLEKGDQHIIRYKPIASLVHSGAVSLI